MNKLKELRKAKNLNQKDLADLLGISQQAYQKYEQGASEMSGSTITKLADFYHVTTDYLLGRDTGEPEPLDSLAGQFNMTALEKKIVEGYLELPENMRGDLMEFLEKTVREVMDKGGE